jgi:hypothetical protein
MERWRNTPPPFSTLKREAECSSGAFKIQTHTAMNTSDLKLGLLSFQSFLYGIYFKKYNGERLNPI